MPLYEGRLSLFRAAFAAELNPFTPGLRYLISSMMRAGSKLAVSG